MVMGSNRSGKARGTTGVPSWLLGWQASLFFGLLTVVLGVIVTVRLVPSLAAIVLLGVLMIVTAAFHLGRALGAPGQESTWRGIAAVVFTVSGVVLIRHLALSVGLISLIIGSAWVIQGVSALAEGASGRRRTEAAWSVLSGAISLAAGIAVMSATVSSSSEMASLIGAWFIVMGVLEMAGALLLRRAARRVPPAAPHTSPVPDEARAALTGNRE